jgi:lysyl-tRNA synthetase class II
MGKESLYNNKLKLTTTLKNLQSFQHLQPSEQLTGHIFTVAGTPIPTTFLTLKGRIQSKRESSKKLLFYTIESEGTSIQVMANVKNFQGDAEKFLFMHQNLKRGDIIGVKSVNSCNNKERC